jgi:hypothetical protein
MRASRSARFPWIVSRVHVEARGNVLHEAAVVQVAVHVAKVAAEKRLAPALGQDVEAEVAPVEHDGDVIGSWRGHTGGLEEFPRDGLAQVRRILHRVVERDLAVAMEGLAGDAFREAQRQRRFVVERTVATGGALEVDRDIRVKDAAFTHRGEDLRSFHRWAAPGRAPVVPAERLDISRGDLEVESPQIRGDFRHGSGQGCGGTLETPWWPRSTAGTRIAPAPQRRGRFDRLRREEIPQRKHHAEGAPDDDAGPSARSRTRLCWPAHGQGRYALARWFANVAGCASDRPGRSP